MTKSYSYKDSGVDIDAGNKLVDNIKANVKSTMRAGANVDIGGFGGLFDLSKTKYKNPILVSGTDGVGTKLKLAIDYQKYDTVGIDLVAMCVNDILVQGAEPLFFMDYFACGALDLGVAEQVISGVAEGCKQANCALIGGETAEMPDMYKAGEFDLAGFTVGAVERDAVLPANIAQGDIILGLKSSGFHSNGYSLVRKIIDDKNIDIKSNGLFDKLIEPTRIYVSALMPLIEAGLLNGLAHITGGGITENIPRVIPNGLCANINSANLQLPEIMQWLQTEGNITQTEMLRTFNCGVGMVIIVSPDNVAKVKTMLNEDVIELGNITKGDSKISI